MKLIELAQHINNLNELSNYLNNKIEGFKSQSREVIHDWGRTDDNKQVESELERVAENIKALKAYKESIDALINMDAQISTKL